MSDQIVIGKSAQEYFRELVSESLTQRRLRVGEATEFYVVNLLAERLRRDRPLGPRHAGDRGGEHRDPAEEPLALMLKKALEGDRAVRWRNLKELGDTSLFVSGFFGDSLSRSLVDIDYYIAMGERAYDALAEEPRGPSGAQAIFGELAERFPQLVDLLAEIAELSELRSNRGLLRLYERFLVTGSERIARQLRDRGVALFAGPGSRRPRDLKH